MPATRRLPAATGNSQKLMIVLFISGAASRKANSSPVVEKSTSAAVMMRYGTSCRSTLSRAPLSMRD